MAVGGTVPSSVTDPALRALLEQLISATGTGAIAPSLQGIQFRTSEGPFPKPSSSRCFIVQWKSGSTWKTIFAVDASGKIVTTPFTQNLTIPGNASIGGNLSVTGNTTLGASGSLTMGGGITRFESAEQAVPASSSVLSVTHGGPRKPDIVRAVLRCKTTEGGWAVGDELNMADAVQDTNRATQTGSNATNVWIDYTGAATPSIRTTTFGLIAVTAANWKVVFYCHWL